MPVRGRTIFNQLENGARRDAEDERERKRSAVCAEAGARGVIRARERDARRRRRAAAAFVAMCASPLELDATDAATRENFVAKRGGAAYRLASTKQGMWKNGTLLAGASGAERTSVNPDIASLLIDHISNSSTRH